MKDFFGRSLIVLLGAGALVAFLAMNGQMDQVKNAISTVAGVASANESTVVEDVSEIVEDRPEVSTLVANASTTASLIALSLLERYDVAVDGYSSTVFGEGWVDVNRNGCSTVNDVLHRDLDPDEREKGCVVTSGTLNDLYTGTTVEFVRGAGTVTVDHLVSAEDAWNGGASNWDAVERAEFYNDPMNLISVSSEAAKARAGANAGSWMPSNAAFHCEYIQRQVKVMKHYNLAVSNTARSAADATLTACSSH